MYKLAFLESMVDDSFFKKSSFIDNIANSVNFAANAKVLNDMTNTALSSKIRDEKDRSTDDRDDDEESRPVRLSVLLTGDLKDKIPEEQRQKLVAIARRISAERKANGKKRRS